MTQDPVAAALALTPLVREAADEAEREARLPARVARAMAKEGLYRIAAPRSLGGGEHDPVTQIETIETISRADGSAGWNLMIGIETFGLIAPGFPDGSTLLADPATVLAGSTASFGHAEVEEGGYRVRGTWPFASGCHNCDWFSALCTITRGGEPAPEAPPRFLLVPRAEIEILETWKVSGLRGSGSHDVRVSDVFVPEAHTASFQSLAEAASAGAAVAPIFRFPRGARLAYNKVGVAFGIARAALDDFVELAKGKVPRFTSATLRERPSAQRALAEAEARLRGARAFSLEAVTEVWERVLAGERVSDEQRALVQIACSDAVRASVEAVDLVAEAAGTTANFVASPLERRARDVRVIRQHMTVAPQHLEDAGRVLLGLPATGLMLNMQ